MDQPLYDIYFTGQLVEGTDPATARNRLAALFKATPDAVERFFDGKPHLLKRGIDKPGALKYKAALHQAGLLVAFKAHQNATQTPTPASARPATPAEPPQPSSPEPTRPTAAPEAGGAWTVAAAGSDVLTPSERQHIEPRDIDTSAIKLVSAFMDFEPEPQPAPPAPNTSHMSVAAAGEDLLTEKAPPAPAVAVNIDDISLAPPGTELDELHDDITPLNPDTSSLSIAAPGVDILADSPPQPAPPPAPDTDHLSINRE